MNVNKQIKLHIVAILTLLASFFILSALIMGGTLSGVEGYIYLTLSKLIAPSLTEIMIVISTIGSAMGVIAITFALLVLPQTRVNIGVPTLVTIAISAGLNTVLKNIFCRVRPDILQLVSETSFSFPSGHSMSNAALYSIIALSAFRHVKSYKKRVVILVICVIAPLIIGISRVYLGVHYAGDVLCGWLLGLCVALIVDTKKYM